MENCPNCGAPISGKVCDYCGTRHAEEVEQITVTIRNDYTDIYDWSGNEVYRVLTGTNASVLRLDR